MPDTRQPRPTSSLSTGNRTDRRNHITTSIRGPTRVDREHEESRAQGSAARRDRATGVPAARQDRIRRDQPAREISRVTAATKRRQPRKVRLAPPSGGTPQHRNTGARTQNSSGAIDPEPRRGYPGRDAKCTVRLAAPRPAVTPSTSARGEAGAWQPESDDSRTARTKKTIPPWYGCRSLNPAGGVLPPHRTAMASLQRPGVGRSPQTPFGNWRALDSTRSLRSIAGRPHARRTPRHPTRRTRLTEPASPRAIVVLFLADERTWTRIVRDRVNSSPIRNWGHCVRNASTVTSPQPSQHGNRERGWKREVAVRELMLRPKGRDTQRHRLTLECASRICTVLFGYWAFVDQFVVDFACYVAGWSARIKDRRIIPPICLQDYTHITTRG